MFSVSSRVTFISKQFPYSYSKRTMFWVHRLYTTNYSGSLAVCNLVRNLRTPSEKISVVIKFSINYIKSCASVGQSNKASMIMCPRFSERFQEGNSCKVNYCSSNIQQSLAYVIHPLLKFIIYYVSIITNWIGEHCSGCVFDFPFSSF